MNVIDEFHKYYFQDRLDNKKQAMWLGYEVYKYPTDLFVLQEIIFDTKPDCIIETGTLRGGSALFLASMCDLNRKGRVISVDIKSRKNLPKHPRIDYIVGSSVDPAVIKEIQALRNGTTMVLLDSCHTKDHVLQEMKMYAPLVTSGCYLIVEDTKLNGNPVFTNYAPDEGPGPMEAVDEFMKESTQFTIDRSKEKFLLTSNPRGFLCKK